MGLSQKQVIDCKGMQCPAPILHIAKAARELGRTPAVLEVIVDDGDFPNDVRAWCRTSKSELVGIDEANGIYTATIALNGAAPGNDSTADSGARPAPVAPRRPRRRPAAEQRPPAQASSETSTLDCRGLQCPAPILALSKAARSFGKQPMLIEILADDAEFPTDLDAWCRTTHSSIIDKKEVDGCHMVLVAINGAAEPLDIIEVADVPDVPANMNAAAAAAAPPAAANALGAAQLDLRGLRAPEPVRQLSAALVNAPGSRVVVTSDDPTFMADVMAWARAAGVTVISAQHQTTQTIVELQLGEAVAAAPALLVPHQAAGQALAVAPTADTTALAANADPNLVPRENRCTILVIKNDFESLMAAMMCATTAAAQGMESVVYFSFWGVNLLRGERPRKDVPKKKKSFLQRMMQWMMPRGPDRQKMSQMHMGGMGLGMMKFFMRKNNVMSLAELMDSAVEQNVRFIVCSMSMGIMGIQKRDIMDLPNVEFAGVTAFVEMSRRSSMSLVF